MATTVEDLRCSTCLLPFVQVLVRMARSLRPHGVKPLCLERTSQPKPIIWNRNLATEFPHNRDAWRRCAAPSNSIVPVVHMRVCNCDEESSIRKQSRGCAELYSNDHGVDSTSGGSGRSFAREPCAESRSRVVMTNSQNLCGHALRAPELGSAELQRTATVTSTLR